MTKKSFESVYFFNISVAFDDRITWMFYYFIGQSVLQKKCKRKQTCNKIMLP